MKDAKVELMNVAFKGCDDSGLFISDPTSETILVATRCEFSNSRYGVAVDGSLISATFKNCVFHDNLNDGILVFNTATLHLHGEATATHSNGNSGISALSSSKVLIHLPSHHNTSYNNEVGDRYTDGGATITNVKD